MLQVITSFYPQGDQGSSLSVIAATRQQQLSEDGRQICVRIPRVPGYFTGTGNAH